MTFNTVGELIDRLSMFDRSTPVLRSDSDMPGYFDINILDGMLFRVKPQPMESYDCYYEDCPPGDTDGFEAVVL
jgi:hypothetical protein